MSFKLPLFDELFNINSKPDPHTNIMSINIETYNSNIKNSINTITREHKIGYLNKNKIKDYGSYIIIVNSLKENGPNCIFCISKSSKLSQGNITKLTNCPGIDNDVLELKWNPCEYPLLTYNYNIPYNTSSYDSKNIKLTFFIKIISTF